MTQAFDWNKKENKSRSAQITFDFVKTNPLLRDLSYLLFAFQNSLQRFNYLYQLPADNRLSERRLSFRYETQNGYSLLTRMYVNIYIFIFI